MPLNQLSVLARPNILLSPHVYYGYNPHEKKDHTFRDTHGFEHIVSSYEDAKTILFVMYTELLKDYNISSETIEQSIKHSPYGNSAYLSLKLC